MCMKMVIFSSFHQLYFYLLLLLFFIWITIIKRRENAHFVFPLSYLRMMVYYTYFAWRQCFIVTYSVIITLFMENHEVNAVHITKTQVRHRWYNIASGRKTRTLINVLRILRYREWYTAKTNLALSALLTLLYTTLTISTNTVL